MRYIHDLRVCTVFTVCVPHGHTMHTVCNVPCMCMWCVRYASYTVYATCDRCSIPCICMCFTRCTSRACDLHHVLDVYGVSSYCPRCIRRMSSTMYTKHAVRAPHYVSLRCFTACALHRVCAVRSVSHVMFWKDSCVVLKSTAKQMVDPGGSWSHDQTTLKCAGNGLFV